jgi:2-polyprenyl-6-hydroxyphenyl methylase/3-demethylubiquinone-9 3-methyltransferase
MSEANFEQEIAGGQRFKFGENWKKFQSSLNDERIRDAEESLKKMLGVETLDGKTFLDIGSGSGLFSLAARNLGAKVHSFDYDTSSVWCTRELKRRFYENDANWTIEQGSVLDTEFLKSLGTYDVVYSWGVLHHTGDMWQALDNVTHNVKEGGTLYIALYNHQQFGTKYWTFVKKSYVSIPVTRPFWIAVHLIYPTLPSVLLKMVQGRKPPRGMTIWYDVLDWLGGYPFEASTPKQVFDFYKERGFTLTQLSTVGGKHGCNEFVFDR